MTVTEAQFTELYRQYAPGIRKLCMSYTGDPVLAQDLLQETFLRAWNNRNNFRGDAKWSTWIYRIAVNTCLSYLRGRKAVTVELEPSLVSASTEADDRREQELKMLYYCISRLPESDRLIIALALEDKPYDEIAEITGITENYLRVKIHRIKKQLSEIYNSYERL